jgi:hypothetical protein
MMCCQASDVFGKSLVTKHINHLKILKVKMKKAKDKAEKLISGT